jgi:hypothetical protein
LQIPEDDLAIDGAAAGFAVLLHVFYSGDWRFVHPLRLIQFLSLFPNLPQANFSVVPTSKHSLSIYT